LIRQVVGWLFARPRPLALPTVPEPPLLRPKLAFPAPVSLIPRFELALVRPAVSSALAPEFMLLAHSPTWSLRLLS
jgi:hypothetical protein